MNTLQVLKSWRRHHQFLKAQRAMKRKDWLEKLAPKVYAWLKKEGAIVIILLCCFSSCNRNPAFAQHIPQPAYTDTEIVNAIWVIEGGSRATYAYGIRSVKYSTIEEARRICHRTVRNNRKRYADYGYKQYPDYLSFLASRYCPTSGKLSKAEQKLNGNWLPNLRKQLQKVRIK